MHMQHTVRLCVVLSWWEKDLARQLAELEGEISLAAVVRRLIRAEALKRGLKPVLPATGTAQPGGQRGC